MPPDGYDTITVSEEVFALLTEIIDEYDCNSIAEAVKPASIITLNRDEAELAQLLADRLRTERDYRKTTLNHRMFYQLYRLTAYENSYWY